MREYKKRANQHLSAEDVSRLLISKKAVTWLFCSSMLFFMTTGLALLVYHMPDSAKAQQLTYSHQVGLGEDGEGTHSTTAGMLQDPTGTGAFGPTEADGDEQQDDWLQAIIRKAGKTIGTERKAGSLSAEQLANAPADAKRIIVYHSHSRESWHPELDTRTKDANDGGKNIRMVGKRLSDALEKRQIGVIHSDVDFPTAEPDYRWDYSYKYSGKMLKKTMKENSYLQFLFDIHRDSQKREVTTTTIEGKDYAKVMFVIGQRNPLWKQNEQFAQRIHEELEKRYPGLSRGVWSKSADTGNAEYNQSLSVDSTLIEIGGIDNTLEESYRTAEALAEVISDLYLAGNLSVQK